MLNKLIKLWIDREKVLMILKFFIFFYFLLMFSIIILILAQQGKGANTGVLTEERNFSKVNTMLGKNNQNTLVFKLLFFFIFLFFSSTLVLNKLLYNENKLQQIFKQQDNINTHTLDENSENKKTYLPITPQ